MNMGENNHCTCPIAKCCRDPTSAINAIYISSSAVIGATIRVYISRLFGEDCELGDDAVQDFFTPFFEKICVTAGGTTSQTGGALFRDWPANLFGSFLMGLVTSHQHTSPFPWYHKDHPMQKNTFLHVGFGVGLCGCLTTFSSWNTQMVVMMDGSYTILGPQIVPALVGYILGIVGCVTSFKIGREVSFWLYSRSNSTFQSEESNMMESQHTCSDLNPDDANDHPLESVEESKASPCCKYIRPIYFLHVLAFSTIGLMLVGFFVFRNPFYKSMTAMVLVAPIGALTRWKMSNWNSSSCFHRFCPWLPWGTLCANLLASIISIACQGILDRYGHIWKGEDRWIQPLLFAIKVGYAGSLSTVSTLVKEVVNLQESHPSSAKFAIYSAATCASGMTLGIMVYMLIVRL